MSLDRYTMRTEPARAREWAEMDRSGNSRHRAKYISCMPGLRASRGKASLPTHIPQRNAREVCSSSSWGHALTEPQEFSV